MSANRITPELRPEKPRNLSPSMGKGKGGSGPLSPGDGRGLARQAPRPAATVVLVRERESGLQVYLLKRSDQSGFFPGHYVFPGGAVDGEDRAGEFWLKRVDLDRTGIGERFGNGSGLEETLGFGVAALRETFEEAGVLLARKRDGLSVNTAPLCERRRAGKLKKGWLREWVAEEGWILSLSRLLPWSHWITPEAFRPRFDTRFFVAPMPGEQTCVPDMQEATHGIWIRPRSALDGNVQGEIPLSPPTLVTLQELVEHNGFKDLEKATAGRSWGEPRLPRLINKPAGTMIIQPWDPMFHEEIRIDEESLKNLVLPPGRPFSRIWFHQGIWRPVRI